MCFSIGVTNGTSKLVGYPILYMNNQEQWFVLLRCFSVTPTPDHAKQSQMHRTLRALSLLHNVAHLNGEKEGMAGSLRRLLPPYHTSINKALTQYLSCYNLLVKRQ